MNDDRLICEKCGDTIDELSAHANEWGRREGFDYCDKCHCDTCKETGKIEVSNPDGPMTKTINCPDC